MLDEKFHYSSNYQIYYCRYFITNLNNTEILLKLLNKLRYEANNRFQTQLSVTFNNVLIMNLAIIFVER